MVCAPVTSLESLATDSLLAEFTFLFGFCKDKVVAAVSHDEDVNFLGFITI